MNCKAKSGKNCISECMSYLVNHLCDDLGTSKEFILKSVLSSENTYRLAKTGWK